MDTAAASGGWVMTSPLHHRVAALLRPPVADAVLTGDALLEPVTVPGLPDGRVWWVSVPSNPHVPRVAVGEGPDGTLRLLTGNGDAFAAVVADLPLTVDETSAAEAVSAFLELTAEPSTMVQTPTAPGEIRWRPGIGDEVALREHFLATVDLAPQVVRETDGFVVGLVLLAGQQAFRARYRVTADGVREIDREVVAESLPLPLVR